MAWRRTAIVFLSLVPPLSRCALSLIFSFSLRQSPRVCVPMAAPMPPACFPESGRLVFSAHPWRAPAWLPIGRLYPRESRRPERQAAFLPPAASSAAGVAALDRRRRSRGLAGAPLAAAAAALSGAGPRPEMRVGHGYDIHRLAPIREASGPIVIAGVRLELRRDDGLEKQARLGPRKDEARASLEKQEPSVGANQHGVANGAGSFLPSPLLPKAGCGSAALGVVAHSDGDVIYHALVDAIFGAINHVDIGETFPDTSAEHYLADSAKFVTAAAAAMRQGGWALCNADLTLILERPKIAHLKTAMRSNTASLLGVDLDRVTLKARTHEKVDAVGLSKAVEAHAVVLLSRTAHTRSGSASEDTTKWK
eukprot:GHVT01070181.1.p1 GENE.GHVT01070181.1~~GHVT01070181.1.p1  ORF type:complete len:366 (-),score=88.36 GHVT01070181.1:261-1358(-)